MKYIKTYEDKFNVGDYVKISNKGISTYISNAVLKNDIETTINTLKSKIFKIIEYNSYKNYRDKFTPYNTKNIDKYDDFNWGWTSNENIRKLNQKEKEKLKIFLDTQKYNL